MIKVTMFTAAVVLQGCSTIPSLPASQKGQVVAESRTEGFLVSDTQPEVISNRTEVRPGNLIQLNSSLDSKIAGQYRVDISGSLKLPYGLSVNTNGLSVQALSEKINAELRKFFTADPQVSVKISDRKFYIEVRGLVQKPGAILVSEFEKVENIIKKSGELTLTKEARVVQIVRGQNTYYIDLEEYFQGRDMNLSPKWYGGEKVFFIQAATALGDDNSASIQVLGDIRNPGAMAFKDGANLYHYVTRAGGTTQTSDLTRVQVVRQTPQGPVMTEGSAIEIAQHIKLEAGDTVFMQSGMPNRTDRQVSMFAAIASILSAIGILIIAL
jgi:protein involved in polysaccharide export with SLBB domain